MKYKVLLVSIMLAIVSVISYADENVHTQDKTAFTVTAQNPTFSIKLKSNPTTGYRWFLRGYNTALITPVTHTMIPATNAKLVGAPGYELWTFRAKAAAFVVPQQTTLRFAYLRPWESGDAGTPVVFHVAFSK